MKNFNSTMVQLIDINIFCDEDSLINFNSTMVQLIAARIFLWS